MTKTHSHRPSIGCSHGRRIVFFFRPLVTIFVPQWAAACAKTKAKTNNTKTKTKNTIQKMNSAIASSRCSASLATTMSVGIAAKCTQGPIIGNVCGKTKVWVQGQCIHGSASIALVCGACVNGTLGSKFPNKNHHQPLQLQPQQVPQASGWPQDLKHQASGFKGALTSQFQKTTTTS